MSVTSSLVLITTALHPPDGIFCLAMNDIAKRRITSKGAVFFWSALGIKKIVVADATGQVFLDRSEVRMLNQIGVEIEQIHYVQNHDLVIERGKGYGEGALIKFALENSRLLKGEVSFFKCTGKVYCRNFIDIFELIDKNNINNIFWRYILEEAMDTRFFYVSKEFCREFLLPVYENINDRKHVTAEISILKMASETLVKGTLTRPLLSGFSGSANEPHLEVSLGFMDQNFPCWLNK